MNISNFTLVSETEKAIKYIVGFKFNENAPYVIFGKQGEEKRDNGYLIECWIPKSIINENGEIPSWFSKNIKEKFGRFNPVNGDLIF